MLLEASLWIPLHAQRAIRRDERYFIREGLYPVRTRTLHSALPGLIAGA